MRSHPKNRQLLKSDVAPRGDSSYDKLGSASVLPIDVNIDRYPDHGDTDAVWKGFAASVTIILFWALDRVLEGAGHGHTHGHAHSSAATSETGSGEDVEKLTVSTRTSRESTPVTKVGRDHIGRAFNKPSRRLY